MFGQFPLDKEQVQPDKKLIIDTNAPDCVFKLTQIAAVMESEDGIIQLTDKVSEESKQLFEKAREGQGFASIEIVYKDLVKDEWVKEIFLIPAFNEGDNLLREDKEKNPYVFNHVVSGGRMGQAASGVIHAAARQVVLILKCLSEKEDKMREIVLQKYIGLQEEGELSLPFIMNELTKFLSIQDDMIGQTFGGAIIKGAESHLEKDYTFHVVEPREVEDITNIRDSFLGKTDPLSPESKPIKLKNEVLAKYGMKDSQDKHLFLIPTEDKKNYEIFYIQNGEFIRSAAKGGIAQLAQEKVNPLLKEIEEKKSSAKQSLIEECLKGLMLDKIFTISNKSLSQNSFSVHNDPDFESFIMYLNPEKYLLDEKKQIMPEGSQWGSFYDIQRSEPMILVDLLRESLVKKFGIQDEEMIAEIKKQQYSQCSSWDMDKFPYIKVIKSYCEASKESKLKVYTDNIHILIRLYEKTLKMSEEKQLIWGENWRAFQVKTYLDDLEERLIQLLISHHKLSKTLDFNSAFKSDLFAGDNRSLSEVFSSLKSLSSDRASRPEFYCKASLSYLEACKTSIMEGAIKFLCNYPDINQPQWNIPVRSFNTLLKQVRLVCSDEKAVKERLKKMLSEPPSGQLSPLENVIKHEFYQTGVMILFYGGMTQEIIEKASSILLGKIKDEAGLQQAGASPSSKNALILDDFLRSYARQIHKHKFILPAELTQVISANAKFLPKSVETLAKLMGKASADLKKESTPAIDPQRPALKHR